jgi:gliding motility-associated-like protein
MKTLALFLCACLCTISALHAQFTITFEDHYPPIGSEIFYSSMLNPLNFDEDATGPDYVWDFSDMEHQQLLHLQVLPIDSAILAGEFATSGWMERSNLLTSPANQEAYLSLTAEGIVFDGYLDPTFKFDYAPQRLLMPYPMSYGDVVSNNWESIVEHQVTGDVYDRVGDITFEMDGYGTLILPHITFDNVVRVYSYSEYTDILPPDVEFEWFEETISWFSIDYNHIVASYLIGGLPGFAAFSRFSYIADPYNIVPLPSIDMAQSITEICEYECVEFTNLTNDSIFDADIEVSWLWTFPGGTPETSTDQNPPEVCYTTPGVFDVILAVTLNSQTFEQVFDSAVHVIEGCAPVASFNHTPIVCRGQCYSFENTSLNATEYFWTFQGATPSTSTDQNPVDICYLNQNGAFNVTLTATNESGTSVSTTQPVLVVNPPNVNAGPDQTIVQGTTTTVSVNAGNGTGQVIWQPYEDVNCFSCASTTTYPLEETTTFIVYYQQAGGCQSSDTLTVFVEEAFGFGIPNTFSPNGDGANDVLYVRGSNISRLNLQIYNRYGALVFETSSQSVGWDGTHNGRDVNPGVFGYILEVSQLDGTNKVVKGDITLVR